MLIDQFISRLCAHLGINNAKIDVSESGAYTIVQIDVSEEDSGLLIGYHGEVLASLQKILQLIYREEGSEKKIVVNVNDYKQRREAQLMEKVTRVAERVLQTGESYLFDFLPANERLVVHKLIVETPAFAELESISQGEGQHRRLEIRLKK